MQQLESLVAGAQAEVARQMQICNACRYCETFCAVFPAMTRRLEFPYADVHYLANLCHNCGACLHACQYAPPHEFQLNFPRLLGQVRAQTYRKHAWPGFLAGAFERNGLVTSLATAASLAFMLLFAALVNDPARLFQAWSDAQGSFYAVLPHGAMVAVALAVGRLPMPNPVFEATDLSIGGELDSLTRASGWLNSPNLPTGPPTLI